ncbi:MAG: ABC transporter substrate-binding protein [Sphingobium sp.]
MRPTIRTVKIGLSLLSSLFLFACGGQGGHGPVIVSVIGNARDLAEPLTYIDTVAGQVVLGATARGLVTFDESGEVIPALAQRWIITDDGKSYIFRLRRARWPNGDHVDAREVARLLKARIAAVTRIDSFGNMAAVSDVVARTTDVIEIRINQARPNFLFMLAQPQMAIARRAGGTGPYHKRAQVKTLLLTPMSDPMTAGVTDDAAPQLWQNRVLRSESAAKAIMRFVDHQADLVTGGSVAELPYLTLAEVDRAAVHLDPVQGLFGLAVTGTGDFVADRDVRAALSMAIDRDALTRSFALNGWSTTLTIVPQQLNMDHPPSQPVWAKTPMDRRWRTAAAIIARWKSLNSGDKPDISIKVGAGPGAKLLFIAIAHDLARIGINAHIADGDGRKPADLTLINEVAPYDSAFWYLGRVSCARKVQCDPQADAALHDASVTADLADRAEKLGEAEVLTQQNGGFIPLATPVRWSLVSRRLTGFAPSPRGYHPLNLLFGGPK